MRRINRLIKKTVAFVIGVSIVAGCTACGEKRKEPKPTPNPTAEIDDGNADASGKGEGQYDTPIVIGTTGFGKKFNPFIRGNTADRQAVSLTQLPLVITDRAGRIVYHGIDGELREYKGNNYTYYGAADIDVVYDKEVKKTSYQIELRDDLVFSNGEKVTIDDVIFTLYAFCDVSYGGEQTIGEMPITGLLNYQANSSKAQKLSQKKVRNYIKKYPSVLKKWVNQYIIKETLTKGFSECKENYLMKGYASVKDCFVKEYGVTGVKSTDSAREALNTAIAFYSKKGYRVLAKNCYQDGGYFDDKIERRARILLSKNTGKKVTTIEGIKKIDENRLLIETDGYERKMSSALQFPICALHYYGNVEKFNVERGKFGFARGDISNLTANKSTPVGAGPYRFVKCENGTVYYTSNENYFAGCPPIAYLHLKDMTEILKETRIHLEKEEAKNTAAIETDKGEDVQEEENVYEKKLAEVEELLAGTVDVISGRFTVSELEIIASKNSKNTLSGNKIHTKKTSDGQYHYIGIHGKNVCVNKEKDSEQSKYLRKALATLFSASRTVLKEELGESISLVNYPIALESWVVPSSDEENYQNAYAMDSNGALLYESDDDTDTKLSAAKEEALRCFEKAGYTVTDGTVMSAPKEAQMEFEIAVVKGEKNVLYPVVDSVVSTLEEIGINLKVRDFKSQEEMNQYLEKNRQELWVGERFGNDTDLMSRYVEKSPQNIFGISDERIVRLSKKLQRHMDSKKRKDYYTKCFAKVLEQAVEVPICQFNTFTLFSNKNFDIDTLPNDVTVFYGWLNEIQKVHED